MFYFKYFYDKTFVDRSQISMTKHLYGFKKSFASMGL